MENTQLKEATDAFIAALHELEEGGDDASVDNIVALFSEDTKIVNSALLLGGEALSGSDGAREFWLDYKKTIGVGKSEFHHTITGDTSVGLFWKTKVGGGEEIYD
ncbi:MAG: hypothetical protein EON58_20170, partial [Alphaproteobacteria bacterium]